MGIGVHELHFLQYAKTFRTFKKTITIGRQCLGVSDQYVRDAVMDSDYRNDKYCEQLLLNYFGSIGKVDSVDNATYEGASIIQDMNLPLPSSIQSSYDTVIDFGCLEHIYNIPQALNNCSLFCKAGGQILHSLPANNCCGHGFWQFSPELFFSLYSNQNGYQDTEVFLVDVSKTGKWFKVNQPNNGKRVEVSSSTEAYVLVRTVLREGCFSHSDVQQSDYKFEWTNSSTKIVNENKSPKPNLIKRLLRSSPLYQFISPFRLNRRNSGLIELNVKSLL
jgi:hypothetical protein